AISWVPSAPHHSEVSVECGGICSFVIQTSTRVCQGVRYQVTAAATTITLAVTPAAAGRRTRPVTKASREPVCIRIEGLTPRSIQSREVSQDRLVAEQRALFEVAIVENHCRTRRLIPVPKCTAPVGQLRVRHTKVLVPKAHAKIAREAPPGRA